MSYSLITSKHVSLIRENSTNSLTQIFDVRNLQSDPKGGFHKKTFKFVGKLWGISIIISLL